MKIQKDIAAMKYLIVLLFFSGCAALSPNKERINISTVGGIAPITQESVNNGSDDSHRQKAKKLGIAYVDYLHMINNNKTSTTKSYIKLRHNNE